MKSILIYLMLIGCTFLSCHSGQNPKLEAEKDNKEKFKKADEDAKFMVKAYSDGLFGVRLEELAQQKEIKKKNKQLIFKLRQDLTKANDKIKQLASAKQVVLPENLTKEQQNILQKLEKMKGNKLDKTFLDETTGNLRDYISLVGLEAQQANDSSLKIFAKKILPVLNQHLDKLSAANGNKDKLVYPNKSTYPM
jgi:putative membrane protein